MMTMTLSAALSTRHAAKALTPGTPVTPLFYVSARATAFGVAVGESTPDYMMLAEARAMDAAFARKLERTS